MRTHGPGGQSRTHDVLTKIILPALAIAALYAAAMGLGVGA